MQAAEDAADGARVVVLDEGCADASGLFEDAGVEGFEEETAGIAEDFGFEDEQIGDGGADDVRGEPLALEGRREDAAARL